MSARRPTHGLVPLDAEFIALTYARVSSKDQEKDGMSLPVQDKENLGYIKAHPPMVFGGAFVDVETGSKVTRNDYQHLLAKVRALAAAGKRVGIITVKQTRLGRDVEEAARAWKELAALGAEIHSTRDGGHLNDELMYLVRAIFAQNDLRVIREGVKATFADVRANGWLKPGRARWGYRWEPATPEQRASSGAPMVVPVPHEHEAEYATELFDRRADGASLRALAAWVRGLPEAARGGRQFAITSIREMLNAPVYIARNPEPGIDLLDVPPGKWQPLVDDATWRRIHPRDGERTNRVPNAARGEFPLTGFLFCEVCGSRMSGQTTGRRNYTCSSRMLGLRSASAACYRTISASIIESLVFGTLTDLVRALADPQISDEARRVVREAERRDRATGDARRLVNAETGRQKLVSRRIGLTNRLADGEITVEAYHEALSPLAVEIDRLDAELARLRGLVQTVERKRHEKPWIDIILDHAPFWYEALTIGTVEDKREFLKLILNRSTPKRLGVGRYLAGLDYTPLGRTMMNVGAAVLPMTGAEVEAVRSAWANCTASTPAPEPSPAA